MLKGDHDPVGAHALQGGKLIGRQNFWRYKLSNRRYLVVDRRKAFG
jgi:hypothetical protein